MSAHAHTFIRRAIAGASAALLLAAELTVVTETVAPLPASAAQDPTQCAGSLSLANGSFEQPAFTGGVTIVNESSIPGWTTTATDRQIEIWRSPRNPRGYPAAQGSQFAELNAFQASTLYQDVATTPGQTLYWSLKHRGREGTDTMRVVAGAPGGTLGDISGLLADGTAAWGTRTGSYTVPAGQTTTRFGFQAVSTATGNQSVGNLLDDIAFGTGPCLVSTKTVANLGGALDCGIPTLVPGATASCGPVSCTLTAADVASGTVVNVATVSGSAGTVTAAATATVDVTALAVTGGVITGLGWALALLAVGLLALLVARVRRRTLAGGPELAA